METSQVISDFPDRLSPVFVRDLRQGLRANAFVWIFIILQVLALVATLVELALLQIIGNAASGPLSSGTFFVVLWGTFCVVLPLSLFGSLQNELGQGRNIELLLAASLTRWQLVRGKLLVASCLSGLLLGSLLPYFLIRYFMGSLELIPALGMIGSIALINTAANAIVIGASGYSNYVGRAAVIIFFSSWFSSSISSVSISILMGRASSPWDEALQVATFIGLSLLFTGLGLQLGRAKIRPFENPIDPPSSLIIFVLAFFTPIIVGITSAAGGMLIACIPVFLLLWLVFSIDPGSSKKNRLKGLQP